MSSRRTFIKTTAAASAGFSILPTSIFAADKEAKVKLGFIGVGLRGQNHVELAVRRNDVEVVAICDIQQRMIDMTLNLFTKANKPKPQVILDGPYGYRKMLENKEIDAVIIATPWEWHAVQSLDAMRAKKYVGCEVITGMNIDECWELVRTSEQTGMPLMMLENVCYRRDVMAVMNMVRQGLFGELIHLQGGYQHDLREVKFNNGVDPYGKGVEFGEKGFSEAQWRTQHSVYRNGDLYPTHGIGPLAMMANINRGNRFAQLVSYSTKARGLHEHIVKSGGGNHPNAKINFKLGDVVTTMIRTANDETVLLQHDTNLPRPYSIGFRVQGTNGIWMDVNKSLYIEGKSKEPHRWEDAKAWLDQYDHPLWKKYGNDAAGAGHGGMDWFVLNAFIESIKRKTNTPQDVYEWFYKTIETKSVFHAKLLYWKQVLSLMFSYAIRKRKKQAHHGFLSSSSFSFAMLRNYFLVASRSLYRQKYFTIVNTVGLAVGMSLSLLLITMVTFVSTYDNFHENKDKIYRVIASYNKGEREINMASAPHALADKLKNEIADIDKITCISSSYYGDVAMDNINVPIRGYYTDSEFLSIFSFELVEGNKATALQKPRSIVITQSTAKKLFGDEHGLGKTIEILKQGNYEITGILKDPPVNTHMSFEMLVSHTTLPVENQNNIIKYDGPFSYGLEFVYFSVREGGSTEKIETYLNQVAKEVSKTSDATVSYELQSLNNITPGPDLAMMTGGLGPQWDMTGFYIFGTICLLILLPACFNYTNISIARAIKRAKEIGLRKTMGGQRNQIFFQFITETVVVTTISLLGALLLFFVVRKEFQSMMVAASSLDLSLTLPIVGLFLLFAVVTGFIAGFAPAFYFSKLNPIQALKNQSGSRLFSGMWLRKGLTVFQFMLSFGFIVALIVFSRQYKYSMNFDFGFDRENILDVRLQNTNPELFSSEYSKLSSVHRISFSSDVLGLHHSGGDSWMSVDGKADSIHVNNMFVDNQYIENLDLKFLAGGNFPNNVWNREQHLIVNEQFLKSVNIADPKDAIGKVVRVNKQDLEIIGVLKDFHFSSLREPIKSFAFRTDPSQYQIANLKVSFTDAFAGISEMESIWKKVGNGTVFYADFMQDQINGAYQFYSTLMKIVAYLGLLAISISLLGMLGMVVYTSEQRTKEVGIRKVLGASVAGITLLLSKDYLKLMGWSFVIGIPLSVLIIDRMLSMMQHYSVTLTVWDIIAGMFILIAMGLLTISSQTLKTASTNPAETLKSE